MHCDIYKFARHDDLYVYIARPDYPNDTEELKDWLGVIPNDFRKTLGEGKFVLHLDLAVRENLARVDIVEVLEKLNEQGYFVQLPPQDVMRKQAEFRAKEMQDKIYD